MTGCFCTRMAAGLTDAGGERRRGRTSKARITSRSLRRGLPPSVRRRPPRECGTGWTPVPLKAPSSRAQQPGVELCLFVWHAVAVEDLEDGRVLAATATAEWCACRRPADPRRSTLDEQLLDARVRPAEPQVPTAHQRDRLGDTGGGTGRPQTPTRAAAGVRTARRLITRSGPSYPSRCLGGRGRACQSHRTLSGSVADLLPYVRTSVGAGGGSGDAQFRGAELR